MPGIIRDFYNVCPKCWSIRVKFRVFKSPRYKCEKCGAEFPNKKRIGYDNRLLFNDLLKLTRSLYEIDGSDIDARKACVDFMKTKGYGVISHA